MSDSPVADTVVKKKTKTRNKIKQPTLHSVILLNDDFTPMDFVVGILIDVFGKSLADAELLTMEVHQKGKGIAGVYGREVADQKVTDVSVLAQHYGHPLKAITQKIS